MKKTVFLLLALLPIMVFGQKAKIQFEETSHHFGTINENDGRVSYIFTYKNVGEAPLILTQVKAGCGCTTPEWNRQPVLPGASGNIKVSFDPRNRPGAFIKGITVNSNAENPVLTLTIRGNVSRKAVSPYANYKLAVGPVRLATDNINLGNITHTQTIEKNIEIINSGNHPASVQVSSTSPALTVSATQPTLKPGQKGKILITYQASAKNDWGFISDQIKVTVNEKIEGHVVVTAKILDDFTAYKNDFTKAPVAHFTEQSIHLENLQPNTTQNHEFFIQNTGKSDLQIRKLITSDENISINVAKTTIKPGKKAKATVSFKTGNQPKIIKIIRFILNDPQHPEVIFKVTGNIQK